MKTVERRILVLYAHPSHERSEVNRPLARATRRISDITFVDLYGEYPTSDIDIDVEQARLREHDVIVFMFPMYWYSTPAILKEWQDLVLEYGFAYGEGGTALRGKVFLASLTTGGPEDAYSTEGYNRFTIRELLAPLEQTARLCGMRYIAPFVLHGARRAAEEGRVGAHVAEWRQVLAALREGRLDIEAAGKVSHLNADIDALMKEES
ncbi:NAD(P)H-dependent oxidoreductase [Algicella marina]|uniref:Flavodoxin family protein n=1 Tax=Algicella marina TaxID=2683284 RepID=A0A6P1T258_9RHOB|nr:NAD(P)H-dependent oxidoreductase [Algicella marina]QHQ35880.1 flavodoxin family protein [Algicella marina]